jgi:hypothetical protein
MSAFVPAGDPEAMRATARARTGSATVVVRHRHPGGIVRGRGRRRR